MSGTIDDNGGGTVRYSVPQAARYLGISERAVRKRITAGSLAAERDGRQWVVFLPAVPGGTSSDDGAVPGAVPEEPIEVDYRVAPAARQQLEAIRDEWLAPLVAQITDQAETIGRLTAERDALQARVSELEAMNAETPAPVVETPQAATDAATGRLRKPRQRKWWLRLFGIDEE